MCPQVEALSPLKKHHQHGVGPSRDHDGEMLACSSAQPSGMDMGITRAVDTMLKSLDDNSHPHHRKMGPVSGWDPGSCRSFSTQVGGQLVGTTGIPVWRQIPPAGPAPDLALLPGKVPGQSTEHGTSLGDQDFWVPQVR